MHGVYTHSTNTSSWENLTFENSVKNVRRSSELTSHTGNVLTVITDRKIPEPDGQGGVAYYLADVVSYADYYPGHGLMPGRHGNSDAYRYGGANGQEKVDEISGEGNHYTAEYWEYDSRTLRRWDTDPVTKHHESPYATFANNPIWFVDPNGADTSLTDKSRPLILDFIDQNSDNYNADFAKDFEKMVNDNSTVYTFDQWDNPQKLTDQNGRTSTLYGSFSAKGKNNKGQNVVNIEYSLDASPSGNKLDHLFEEFDHGMQFMDKRIGFVDDGSGNWSELGYDFYDEVDNKISRVKYLDAFGANSKYNTKLYGTNAKILKSNFSRSAAERIVRLNYAFADETGIDVFQAFSNMTGNKYSANDIENRFKSGERWNFILIGGN